MNQNDINQKENSLKKESMVPDYLLVLLYIAIVAMLFWVLLARVDFMMYVLPYGAILAVTLLLANYLHHILKPIQDNDQVKKS